jgi:transcriptional regulator with XRE-family HTH domain
VSKSEIEKKDKSCILTCSGQEKLKNALSKRSYTQQELSDEARLDRAVISKILHNIFASDSKPQKAVTRKSLSDFCSECLKIDLEETDYDNPPKTQVRQRRHNQTSTSLKIDYATLPESNCEKLKCALEELNYANQKFLFDKAINQVKPAATFLIHGKPNYGQRWLVNLLKYEIPYHTNAWQKSLYIKPHRRNIQTLWESLAEELETSASPEAIAQKFYHHWQRTTVILAIHDVDLIAGNCLKQFIDELWQPLVNKVNNAPPQQRHRLVLFLVDNKNSKSKLEASLSLVAKPDNNQSHIPLALEELEPFNRNLIDTWVGVKFELLSQLWKSSESMEQVMQEIVERDSQPISVFTNICECIDLNWHMDIERGLAL